jgi:hypothetical protein
MSVVTEVTELRWAMAAPLAAPQPPVSLFCRSWRVRRGRSSERIWWGCLRRAGLRRSERPEWR